MVSFIHSLQMDNSFPYSETKLYLQWSRYQLQTRGSSVFGLCIRSNRIRWCHIRSQLLCACFRRKLVYILVGENLRTWTRRSFRATNPTSKSYNSIYRKDWIKYQILILNSILPKTNGVVLKSPWLIIYMELITENFENALESANRSKQIAVFYINRSRQKYIGDSYDRTAVTHAKLGKTISRIQN